MKTQTTTLSSREISSVTGGSNMARSSDFAGLDTSTALINETRLSITINKDKQITQSLRESGGMFNIVS